MPATPVADKPLGKRYRYDEDGELEKQCTQCLDWWPADRDFFGSNPRERNGLHPHCLACTSERTAMRRRAMATA